MKHLIIITVYNKPQLTRRCLESIARTTNLDHNLLFVVDDYSNHSTQAILKKFQEAHPEVIVHRNKRNFGKPKSINIALRRFPDMDYYTIIDNDVTIQSKDWVNTLIVAHRDWDNKVILGAYTYMTGYAVRKNRRHYLDPWPYWNLAGCFFSFSKRVFRKLGLFSDVSRRSEDVDYCKRAYLAGFHWFYITDIRARISGYKHPQERKRLSRFHIMEQKQRRQYSDYVMLTHDVYYPPRRQPF